MPQIIPRYIGVSELLASRFACHKDMKSSFSLIGCRITRPATLLHLVCFGEIILALLAPVSRVENLSIGADWSGIPKTEGMPAARITHPIIQIEGR